MSSSLAGTVRSDEAPSPGRAGPLLSLLAAAVFPFDAVLAGMVAAGLGMEALCVYLSLSRAALDDSLVRLGLPTPNSRPIRKAGYRGWSAFDITRLIVWRVAGVHPESIGARLGRSATGVRAKCRRLGIPAPPRNLLHRLDPLTLIDPTPGFASTACVPAAKPVQQRRTESPSSSCGTAADAPTWSRSKSSTPASPDLAAVRFGEPVIPPPGSLQSGVATNGSTIPLPPAPTSPALDVAAPAAEDLPPTVEPVPEKPCPFKQAIDRAVADGVPLQKSVEVVKEFALRILSCQNHKAIAKHLNKSPSSVASFRSRCEIPSDPDRSKMVDSYDEEVGRANFERFCVVKTCIETGKAFVAPREDKNVKHCRPVRFAKGRLSAYDKHKRWLVDLIPPKPVLARGAAIHLTDACQPAS